MLKAIALARHILPVEMIKDHQLETRTIDRGGEKEIRFVWYTRERVMPCWVDDQLQLVTWGCRRKEPSPSSVPLTQAVRLESLQSGALEPWHPKVALVPASAILVGRGVWISMQEAGMLQAVVLLDGEKPRIYLLMVEADHYWHVMTGDTWMPLPS